MCVNNTLENKQPKIEQLIVNNELLNIIRRAAVTKNNYDLGAAVRIILEIPEDNEA